MKRRICIVTGTRAEYGLLRGVIAGIAASPDCTLQLVVTAAHLSPEFGMTVAEIEEDGFPIAARVEMLLSSDTSVGVGKAMGLGLIGFADVFDRLRPDLLVVLGDRFEVLAAASAALVAAIPIAHIHGGEVTEGAFDDAIRHSVTKMAHLHFVAAETYKQRVIQLGEAADRIFLTGGLGIDAIHQLQLLDRSALEAKLGFKLGDCNLLVTFHPPTLAGASAVEQMKALLDSLSHLPEKTRIIFTLPNADSGARELRTLVEDFVAEHANARAFASLGQFLYLSTMRHMDVVVGNSSSGIIEAPSFRIGTVNIGDRQKGRLMAESVISCPPTRPAINEALARALSADFQASLATIANPYGEGKASAAIVATLRKYPLEGLLKKQFCDIGTDLQHGVAISRSSI